MEIFIFCLLSLHATFITCHKIVKPHIVFISANDIGYNDISLHGSDLIYTPNIDMIGIQGIKIANYYTDCDGTPSMSALLTGKYPMKMGTQGPSIKAGEDRGVPTSERLLPSYLKDFGYATHFVGTWLNGKSRDDYLPMNRGFDSFDGTTSIVDYFTYDHVEIFNDTQYSGRDFYHNLSPIYISSGRHLTEVFTDIAVDVINKHNASVPLYLHVAHAAAHVGGGLVNLQAASEDITANEHIAHSAKRIYAGLVTGVDRSVGNIIDALSENNLLNNTLVIFIANNGASIGWQGNFGTNMPLRGGKGTPWEGGVRSIAHLWHAALTPKIFDGLFHVTDWVKTLIAATGLETNNYNLSSLDGVNQWDSLVNDEKPKRDAMIVAVDDVNEWGAFRDGDLKMIIGNIPNSNRYYGQQLSLTIPNVKRLTYEDALRNSTTALLFAKYLNIDIDMTYVQSKRDYCNIYQKTGLRNNTASFIKMCIPTNVRGCLYNISADPEESQDIWDESPKVVIPLSLRFRSLWSELVPRKPVTFDPRADPINFNYVWKPWVQTDEMMPLETNKTEFPLEMTKREMQYFMKLHLAVVSQKLSDYMESLGSSLMDSIGHIFST